MANCYIHTNKGGTHNCSTCSKSICRECTFQEVVSSRVVRTYRGRSDYEYDYEFFCPHCFLDYAEGKGYHKSSRGVMLRWNKSPNKGALIVLWSFFIGGLIINFFFPIGYVLWVGTLLTMIWLKVLSSRNYEKYLNAQRLAKGGRIKEKPKPTEGKKKKKDKFCPNCGATVIEASDFCNKCGSILNA
ncbi:MAG: zinc ribbon domain-containing protein [Candidatus Heimdallarchaeota archaeon]|nr:zinc ribbon domain-containing protein [Candidatus Heimdallarchaeota archaeon]MBY8993841.1 zinc ribbon domain-containing protein [Candidatus Heimdallarchaeota archaeon]